MNGNSDWDWFPKINPNDANSTDQNNKGVARTSHRKLTETEVEEIDNYFELCLSGSPPLEKLIDTTLYYEKTYINNNISEILDDWYKYIKKVNYDDKECFEYWIRCPFPSLIFQALRYLQFICQKESIRFNRIRNSILIGDTKALYDHAESLDYIYYPILKLISLCWDALTLPQEYTKQSERKILEILTDVSERTAENRLADFEINEPKNEKEFIRIRKENEMLSKALIKKAVSKDNEELKEKENDKNKEKDPDETTLIPNNSLSAIELIPHVMKSLGYDPLAYPSFRGFKKIVYEKAKDEHSIIFRMSFESFYKGQNSTFNKAEGRGLIKKKL